MSQGVFLSELRQDSSALVVWKSMLYFPRNRSSAKKAEFKVLKLQVKLLSISVGNMWESGSSAVNSLPFSVLEAMEDMSQMYSHHPPHGAKRILLTTPDVAV